MLFEFLRLVPPDISRYLPRFLQKDTSFKSLTDTINWEHERQRQIAIDLYKQFFVRTATWGLADWERVVEVKPNTGDDFTQRRNRIELKLNGTETSTNEFLNALVRRYVSEDSDIRIVTDNPHYAFEIVSNGGRILYPEDMLEAVELYKPAHLGLVLNIVREYKMTDKEAIRVAILDNINGRADIKSAMPSDGKMFVNVATAHLVSGTRKLPFTLESETANNIAALIAILPNGRKDIPADRSDIEKAIWSILEPSRMTAKIGSVIQREGQQNIFAAIPSSGNIPLQASVFGYKNGAKHINNAPPTADKQNIFAALLNMLDGRRDVAANRDEQSPSILNGSLIAPRLANAFQREGLRQTGIVSTEEHSAAKVSLVTLANLDGRKDIAANREDLPDSGDLQFSRITPNVASVTQTEGHKQIFAAIPQTGDIRHCGLVTKTTGGTKNIFGASLPTDNIKAYFGSTVICGGVYHIGANQSAVKTFMCKPHVGIMHVGAASVL